MIIFNKIINKNNNLNFISFKKLNNIFNLLVKYE